MRSARLAAALLPTVWLAGCLQSAVLIKVGADGSGTIDTQTLMTSAAVAQLRQFTGALGGDAKPVEFFTEAQAREIAAGMGDGVVLTGTRPLRTASAEGREAIYRFVDVTKLRLSQVPATPGGGAGAVGGLGLSAQNEFITIGLARNAAGNSVLTLHLGANPLSAAAGQTGAADAGRGMPLPADQIALMQPMLAGMRIAIRVEPAGRLVKTSSPYVQGNTVTLFDIDLDTLFGDPAFQRLQSAKTSKDAKDALKDLKGAKLNLDPDITIEFAP